MLMYGHLKPLVEGTIEQKSCHSLSTVFSSKLPIHLPLCSLPGNPNNTISTFRVLSFSRMLPRIPARTTPRVSPAGHVYACVPLSARWICASVSACRILRDCRMVHTSMCVFVCLITRECTVHSRETLHCSVHKLHKAARARRSLSAAEQQQNKPGRQLPTAQAPKCNLFYLQLSFPCFCKTHTVLLLISGHNKDGFATVWIRSLIQCNDIGSASAWLAVPSPCLSRPIHSCPPQC